ncbi:MAG: bifunctional hydroxymethylpyrimidine kinase/phosphomethylpyrimidine kinase [Bradymonadaceae bacterium]|nr:bifunctional hydroxymethylpyrimidine kinase/phosphomethylpyrimidine kinase [Lujinxingiaceae bacterium]
MSDIFSFFEKPKLARDYDAAFPIALTIAGSDSGGGAGIQADLKTFAALEVFGTSVLTMITAQNTVGVSEICVLDEQILRAQYNAVMTDLRPWAAKTGAMGSNTTIGIVAELLEEHPIDKLVVDPVMISKHGEQLLPDDACKALRERLMDKAFLVMPNRHEAAKLTGRTVEGPTSMKDAAKRIFDFGARNVLIKGGHLEKIVRDFYYDGSGFVEFGADRVDSGRLHGSGCVYAAAIVARLCLGDELLAAIEFSREFISGAIEKAPKLGAGISPVNPMHRLWE